jgi:hypothetical protein
MTKGLLSSIVFVLLQRMLRAFRGSVMVEKIPGRIIYFGPDKLEFGIAPDPSGRPCVVIRLLGVEEEAGMTPGIGLAMALFPTEARHIANLLTQKAAEAETLKPPH